MSEPAGTPQVLAGPAARRTVAIIFLLFVGVAFSEEATVRILEANDLPVAGRWRWVVLALDLVLLWAVAVMKHRGERTVRLWGWWFLGFTIAVAADAALIAAGGSAGEFLDLAAATALVVGLAVLMTSSVDAHPLTLVSSRRRRALPDNWVRARWTIPFIMGTYAALIGASIWSDALNVGVTRELSGPALAALEGLPLTERQSLLSQLCSGAVDQEYFAQVSQAIPLLLVTLGIETGFFRRGLREPAQRAATIATVTMLCVGLMSALSTLPLSGSGCGNVLPAWHEYFGLVFTLQAVFVALTTLIWVLAINTPDEETPVR